MGNLPIFFSSRQRAEAGRSRPEVWGGETGRGTRATVCGTQKTGARARGAGCGARETGARARAQGAGPRVRGAGRGCGTRKTRAWGAGRKTRNAEHVKRGRGHGHGARETGDGRRGTGDGAQAPVHGTQRDRIRPARPRNNLPGPFTAGRHPPPGPIRRDLSRLDARRRDPQQPAGPFTAGRHPPPGPATTRRGRPQPGAFRRGPHPTCRAYESESRRCRRARRTCCCRAAPRPT